MIVKPRVRGFICSTAHPEGCRANVLEQINYVQQGKRIKGPKNVLIIGASTGYGLATRIVAMAGAGANTIGVFYEKEAKGKRTASPGWYNSVFFEEEAIKSGLKAISINGDAFSDEIKAKTIEKIKAELGTIDLVVYSLAAPRRIDPKTGIKHMSTLKPVGESYTNKSIDIVSGKISMATIESAVEEEITDTIKVMGGEDWELWIEALLKEKILSAGAKTIAYSYIGPEVTKAIYREGTIGRAKVHLEETSHKINSLMLAINGSSHVVVAKALVTQASAAIPIVPLYVAALYKVMKEKGTHEGCIEQIYRLFTTALYEGIIPVDDLGRIRIDNLEMDKDTQEKAIAIFSEVTEDNLFELMDLKEYQKEFYRLFGFEYDGVNYEQDIIIERDIPSL